MRQACSRIYLNGTQPTKPARASACRVTARLLTVSDRSDTRVVILGSGRNRIGQGIEFDYCCVRAAMTVRESGPRTSRPVGQEIIT